MGAAMIFDILKSPTPVVLKPRKVLAAGLEDLKYDR